jgi:hypothetical protein
MATNLKGTKRSATKLAADLGLDAEVMLAAQGKKPAGEARTGSTSGSRRVKPQSNVAATSSRPDGSWNSLLFDAVVVHEQFARRAHTAITQSDFELVVIAEDGRQQINPLIQLHFDSVMRARSLRMDFLAELHGSQTTFANLGGGGTVA